MPSPGPVRPFFRRPALHTAWADPEDRRIEELIGASQRDGWRAALAAHETTSPVFVGRMRDTALGNWHLLLLKDRAGRALDVGCGFGSLALGLGQYYTTAIGVERLANRLVYGALRGIQEETRAVFANADAFDLPFRAQSFDLVVLHGVLEWATLYRLGSPVEVQQQMLREMSRVARWGGTIAIAIENRYAAETLTALQDTHTGLHFVPALPRRLADWVSRLFHREAYRTYLHSRRGYSTLFRGTEVRNARVFDLISSYNDYDFVVALGDTLTYQLLWDADAIRSFYQPAMVLRRMIARLRPQWLSWLSYAYLVFGTLGSDTAGEIARADGKADVAPDQGPDTVLDPSHPLWEHLRLVDVMPDRARFMCHRDRPGIATLVMHDGHRISAVVEYGVDLPSAADMTARDIVPPALAHLLPEGIRPTREITLGGVTVRVFPPRKHAGEVTQALSDNGA